MMTNAMEKENRITLSKNEHKLLYVGGFELPDRNAAAHRVIGIAKAMRELGYEVYFLNYTSIVTESRWNIYFGFACYDNPKQGLVSQITDISDVRKVIREKKIDSVIMYNYPAISMLRLLKWCKKKSIKCYADATEWYMPMRKSLHALIKTWDSETRMKKLHFKTDGVIAISEFLYQYYKDKVPVIKIPPVVDIQDEKWSVNAQKESDCCIFVYAGTPSAQKECLDKIVVAIEKTQHPALLQIIGITKEQYEAIYHTRYTGTKTEFLGGVAHSEVISLVKQANWSVIIRENNQVVKAGFPTKLVESISCGTPVIANRFSNIDDYLNADNSILCDMDSLGEAVEEACMMSVAVDKKIFDFRNYLNEIKLLIN